MNEKARNPLGDFCARHKLAQESLSPGLADMIRAASTPYSLMHDLLVHESFAQFDLSNPSNPPSNGLLLKLIDRSYSIVEVTLTLVALGHLREAEILSRSIFESGVTTTYILKEYITEESITKESITKESLALRLVQFLFSYVKQKCDNNRKWHNDLDALPPEIQQEHQRRIDSDNQMLGEYEAFMKQYREGHKITRDKAAKWPGLIERLTELKRRIDYRTVYPTMSSQAHQGAEDILKNFIANQIEGSVQGAAGTVDCMEREIDTSSINMVLFGLHWFVCATRSVCLHFSFHLNCNFLPAVNEADESLDRIKDELASVALYVDKGKFPERWSTGYVKPLHGNTWLPGKLLHTAIRCCLKILRRGDHASY